MKIQLLLAAACAALACATSAAAEPTPLQVFESVCLKGQSSQDWVRLARAEGFVIPPASFADFFREQDDVQGQVFWKVYDGGLVAVMAGAAAPHKKGDLQGDVCGVFGMPYDPLIVGKLQASLNVGAPQRDRDSATFVYDEQDGVRRGLEDASEEAMSRLVAAGRLHMVMAQAARDKSDMTTVVHIIMRP